MISRVIRTGLIAHGHGALGQHGFVGTVVHVLRLVTGMPARRARARRARSFDALLNVDTAGILRPEALDLRGSNAAYAHRYEGADPEQLATALEKLDLDFSNYSFVDLGSGKGRAVLLAAQHRFKRVIGVELSERLHRVATENLERASRRGAMPGVELICSDAGTFGFPAGNLIVYLYNPFDEPVLRSVLRNLQTALAEEERHALIIFWGDRHLEQVLDESLFARLAGEPVWSSPRPADG